MSGRRLTRLLPAGFLAIGALLGSSGAALAADEPAKAVTFSKDVAPIFQAKCQSCHQPESIVNAESLAPGCRCRQRQSPD